MEFLQVVKDYQSIIGGVLNAGVATCIALFVTRRVVERGRIAFYPTQMTVALWIRKAVSFTSSIPKISFDTATNGRLEILVDLYNSSGVRRIMREMQVCMKVGKKVENIHTNFPIVRRGEISSSRLSLDPKELARISIDVPLVETTISRIRDSNPEFYFTYRDERNRLKMLIIGKLKGNPEVAIT
jgi:hypothetical protein